MCCHGDRPTTTNTCAAVSLVELTSVPRHKYITWHENIFFYKTLKWHKLVQHLIGLFIQNSQFKGKEAQENLARVNRKWHHMYTSIPKGFSHPSTSNVWPGSFIHPDPWEQQVVWTGTYLPCACVLQLTELLNIASLLPFVCLSLSLYLSVSISLPLSNIMP